MTARQPFAPNYGRNQVLSPAAGSASVVIDPQRLNDQLRFYNSGANKCYVRTFDSRNGAQSATTADYPIGPGAYSTITKFQDDDSLATISAAGTTLEVIPGRGF